MKKDIYVVKRNGERELFNINKIIGYLEYAKHGLNVDIGKIIEELMHSVKDGMSTEQVQKILITNIVLKTDVDKVDNAILAGRLFIYDLRHKVTKKLGKLSLRRCIEVGIEYGIYDPVLLTFDIELLAAKIDHGRDDYFTHLGADTFTVRYIKKDKAGEAFEVPQFVFMGVAMTLMQHEKEKELRTIEYYDVLSKREAMNGTPTLSNARTLRCQMNSCYVGITYDSAEGILHARNEMAILSKFGGGIGWSDAVVRAAASFVNNVKGAAGGLVPMAVHTNAIQLEFDQLGCVSNGSKILTVESIFVDGVEYDLTKRLGFVDYKSAIENYVQSMVSEILGVSSSTYNEDMLEIERYVKIPVFNGFEQAPGALLSYLKGKYLPKGFKPVKLKDKEVDDILINENALLIDINTLQVIPTKKTKGGKVVSVTMGDKTYSVASIMARTFLGYEGGLIYQKDNNTLNCNLDNLSIVNEDIQREERLNYHKAIDKVNEFFVTGFENGDRIQYKSLSFDEVKPGMFALSFNESDERLEIKKILSKHTVKVEKRNQITIKTTEGPDGYTTSAWHPTPVERDGKIKFIRADEVLVGENTVSTQGGIIILDEITDVSKGNEDEEFIDFTIEDNHNYFVDVNGSYCLTHNTRKGAIASYIEPWHMDIYEFLDLHKPTGDIRRRAYDMNIALWENELFRERVQNDEEWTLFDPYETSDLHDVYGEEFRKLYEKYERSRHVRKVTVRARELETKIMTMAFESGQPYAVDKDEANRRHMNKHLGVIRSSNLCSEILQYTKAGDLYTYIYNNKHECIGRELGSDTNDTGVQFSKLMPGTIYNNDKVAYIENKIEDDEIAVCTLGSINLSIINTEEDIARVVPIMMRGLDNIIDINYYPVKAAYVHATKTRAVGLGVMGEHHMLAKEGIEFGSKEAHQRMDQVMEWISYYAIKASAELAQEKGAAPGFKGSEWEKGVLPIDFQNQNTRKLIDREHSMDWDSLRELTKQGMRNLYLLAVAPTTNIAVITNTTPSIEPVFKRIYTEKTSIGEFRTVVPDLSPDTFNLYRSAYDYHPMRVIENMAVVQQWLDQATSGNLFPNTNVFKKTSDLSKMFSYARYLGVVSIYYTRGKSPEEILEDNTNGIVQCEGCQ